MSTFLFGDDWKLQLARGKLRNAFHVHKFGRNTSPANGNEETVWDGSNLYPWATWAAGADNVYLKSSATGDESKTIFIQGLDADFNVQSETVTLDATNSTTGVASANTYVRLFRMYNSGNTAFVGNVGAHYGSASGTLVAQVLIGQEQTLMGVYTVPAGHTAYLMKYDFSGSANAAIASRLLFREPNGVFRIQHSGAVYGGQYDYEFQIPLSIPEKTDIDLRLTASTGSAVLGGNFNLIVVKENEFNEWSGGY
jgi:hypothetical protein